MNRCIEMQQWERGHCERVRRGGATFSNLIAFLRFPNAIICINLTDHTLAMVDHPYWNL